MKKLFAWLLRLLMLPCLAAWTLVRLWLPFEALLLPEALIAIAFLLSTIVLIAAAVWKMTERLLLPWGTSWKSAIPLVIAFPLGWFFDISLSMLEQDIAVLSELPFDALCHTGNAIIFSVIVLAVTKAVVELKDLFRVDWKQILFIFVTLNMATFLYAATSQTIYVWDNAGYWAIARTLMEEPLDYDHIIAILETTLTLDYNHLLAFPISLVMRLFGGSRTVFLFAVSNLYTLPALWGLNAIANSRRWSGLVLVGLFPMLGYTAFVGFVDVFCCGLGIWAYHIYTSDRPPVSRGILSGTLLVLTFLFRRYFLFFAASFGVAAFLHKLLFDRKRWADFLSLFLSCALSGLTFTYRFLLDKVLNSEYGELYSAYDLGRTSDFVLFCRYFGLLLLILFLAAAIVGLAKKENRGKLVFSIIQVIVCFLAFTQVQSHGQQHLLMYLPALALITITALSSAPQYLSALMALVTSTYCFIPKIQPSTVTSITVFDILPSFQFYGPKRSDINQLLSLAEFVDSLSSEEEKTAVVLASSFTFNSETLSSLYSSLNLPEPAGNRTQIQYHGTVDKRDSFNWNTAFADYLIVGDPVQVHLGEENQQVMSLLVEHILAGTGPGEAYSLLSETFYLANDVTVRIYQRERDWYIDEYHTISDPLIEKYPEFAALYKIPSWIK